MRCFLNDLGVLSNVGKGFTITLNSTKNKVRIRPGHWRKMIDYSKSTLKSVQSGHKYLRASQRGIYSLNLDLKITLRIDSMADWGSLSEALMRCWEDHHTRTENRLNKIRLQKFYQDKSSRINSKSMGKKKKVSRLIFWKN